MNCKTLGFIIVFSVVLSACAAKTASELPKEILGIPIGMSREDAERRLEEIAAFESDHQKFGQLWKLKNDPHFSSIAVAYDKDDRVRFVTAFVEKAAAKEKIRFADVGDLTKAKAEILEAHHRYIWEVDGDGSAYVVNIYGDNPDFVTTFSLAKKN